MKKLRLCLNCKLLTVNKSWHSRYQNVLMYCGFVRNLTMFLLLFLSHNLILILYAYTIQLLQI